MRFFRYSLFAVACICFASAPAEGSIKISLDPANLATGPSGNEVSFLTGAVDPSGGNSGFLGRIWDPTGTTLLEEWETFCVEATSTPYVEYISLNDGHYKIESTTDPNAVATSNHVTDAAKWVYYAFGHGLLTGWVTNDGEEVQEAIWSLVRGGGSSGPFLVTANGKAATWATQAATAVSGAQGLAEASRIRIINPAIYNGDGSVNSHHQSMLYEIPEPLSVAVWSGLIAVVGLRRNRR